MFEASPLQQTPSVPVLFYEQFMSRIIVIISNSIRVVVVIFIVNRAVNSSLRMITIASSVFTTLPFERLQRRMAKRGRR